MRRRRYFIGELDPSTSIESSRGCPWNCSFCSAWTFYGRSYRKAAPGAAAEELAGIAEPNVGALRILDANLAHGQANFARMLWRFNKVYNAGRQSADHRRPVRYELPLPPQLGHRRQLYVHTRAPVPHRNRSAATGPGRREPQLPG